MQKAPLAKYSSIYYLTYMPGPEKDKRINFNLGSTPTFFKMLGNDSGRIFRYVRSGVLYTNTKYLVVFPRKFFKIQHYFHSSEIDIEQTFNFRTMNQDLVGMVLSFQSKSDLLNSLFQQWKYKIETHETLSIIWPPTYQFDYKCYVNSDSIYVYSSFQLNSRENTNVSNENIHRLTSTVSKVNLLPKTIIHKKNTELIIYKSDSFEQKINVFQSHLKKTKVFKVPEDGLSYFLFGPFGIENLKVSQTVFLTPGTKIIGYSQSYPIVVIYPNPQYTIHGDELLEDILAHYKKTESYTKPMVELETLSEAMLQYIRKCKIKGRINSVVRQYIEEGRL